ncbi:hypothetical protein ACFLQL_02285 [Verrucomicrobiota bacterium]
MNEAYKQGFEDLCKQAGVNPVELIKLAQESAGSKYRDELQPGFAANYTGDVSQGGAGRLSRSDLVMPDIGELTSQGPTQARSLLDMMGSDNVRKETAFHAPSALNPPPPPPPGPPRNGFVIPNNIIKALRTTGRVAVPGIGNIAAIQGASSALGKATSGIRSPFKYRAQ